MALRITKAFGGTAEFWVRMQASHDSHDLRKAEIEISKKKIHLKAYKYNVA